MDHPWNMKFLYKDQIVKWINTRYNIFRDMQDYINRYQIIYKRCIKDAKQRANDKYVLRAKNKKKATKAMWHVINKELKNL
jgi:hypothetical protein